MAYSSLQKYIHKGGTPTISKDKRSGLYYVEVNECPAQLTVTLNRYGATLDELIAALRENIPVKALTVITAPLPQDDLSRLVAAIKSNVFISSGFTFKWEWMRTLTRTNGESGASYTLIEGDNVASMSADQRKIIETYCQRINQSIDELYPMSLREELEAHMADNARRLQANDCPLRQELRERFERMAYRTGKQAAGLAQLPLLWKSRLERHVREPGCFTNDLARSLGATFGDEASVRGMYYHEILNSVNPTLTLSRVADEHLITPARRFYQTLPSTNQFRFNMKVTALMLSALFVVYDAFAVQDSASSFVLSSLFFLVCEAILCGFELMRNELFKDIADVHGTCLEPYQGLVAPAITVTQLGIMCLYAMIHAYFYPESTIFETIAMPMLMAGASAEVLAPALCWEEATEEQTAMRLR